MKNCFVDVRPEVLSNVINDLPSKDPDNCFVMPIIAQYETLSPTTNKNCFRIKLELVIPQEAIVGEEALEEVGFLPILRLPKKRINPVYSMFRMRREESR